MRRLLSTLLMLLAVIVLAGVISRFDLWPRRTRVPDPPAVIAQMREVAQLQTLRLSVYKKVSFEPDPSPTGTLVGDAFTWAKFTLRPPRGRAIVFAELTMGLDLSKLSPATLRVRGDEVEVVLPPLRVEVVLKPRETEVIGSNLDSQQTAQLLEVAREAFAREAEADPELKERARASAERALTGLLMGLGFRRVTFVQRLGGLGSG